jgi:hypothetical protein
MPVPWKNVAVQGAFAALDAEWAVLCRRHRNSAVVARWARSESELADVRCLADVVPPAGVDRTARFGAVVRLTQMDDDLAARALLQLLVPGLVRLAKRLRARGEPFDSTAVDVISTAWMLIERVKTGNLQPRTASYLLLWIRRYTALMRERPRRMHPRVPLLDDGDTHAGVHCQGRSAGPQEQTLPARSNVPLECSAEDQAFAGPLAAALLADAVDAGTVSRHAASLLWSCAVGDEGVPTVAAQTGTPVATAYRLRNRAQRALREAFADAS